MKCENISASDRRFTSSNIGNKNTDEIRPIEKQVLPYPAMAPSP